MVISTSFNEVSKQSFIFPKQEGLAYICMFPCHIPLCVCVYMCVCVSVCVCVCVRVCVCVCSMTWWGLKVIAILVYLLCK